LRFPLFAFEVVSIPNYSAPVRLVALPIHFGSSSLTSAHSSFSSFSVASIFARLNWLTGVPWTISSF
jgi:hypothetical protein